MSARLPSRELTAEDAALVRALLPTMSQHDIAALFGCNQGRIAEIAKGHRFEEVAPADLRYAEPRALIAARLASFNMRIASQLRDLLTAPLAGREVA